MPAVLATSEISMLYVLATLVATMLGGLLLHFGRREKISALNWWGAAYLISATAIAVWAIAGGVLGDTLSAVLAAVGIGACGLIWTAARVFHGRKPVFPVLASGIAIWLVVLALPDLLSSYRLTIGAAIVAIYVGLAADELMSERRRSLKKGWPVLLMPTLHATVLLLPILIGDIIGSNNPSGYSIWSMVFAIELVLYALGTVFVIFMLVSERTVLLHKVAALTDPLTGLFNRRGFATAAARLIDHQSACGGQVSLMVFDLDRFKSINDRFGHPAGDEILKLFADVVTDTLRTTDISGRLGGEEFSVILPCGSAEALIAAERVRVAFATSGTFVDDLPIETTVSIGIASGSAGTDLSSLLNRADEALYCAKHNGRNRTEIAPSHDGFETSVQPDKRKVTVMRRPPELTQQPM